MWKLITNHQPDPDEVVWVRLAHPVVQSFKAIWKPTAMAFYPMDAEGTAIAAGAVPWWIVLSWRSAS